MSDISASYNHTPTYDEAHKATWYLDDGGCTDIAEVLAGSSNALQPKTVAADYIMQQYLAASPQDCDLISLARISARYHRFQAANAASVDEIRDMADAYDYLHPYETPKEQKERKQELVGHWLSVQVLAKHIKRTAELAPVLAADEYQLPEGYDVSSLQSYAVAIDYTREGGEEAIRRDLQYYEAYVDVASRSQLSIHGTQPSMDSSSEFRMGINGTHISQNNGYESFGTSPIEHLAHVIGRPVTYSGTFELRLAYPISRSWEPTAPRVPVPFDDLARTITAAAGQRVDDYETILDARGVRQIRNDEVAVSFTGNFVDGQLAAGLRDSKRESTYKLGRYRTPILGIELDLSEWSIGRRGMAAQRLSAWLVARTVKGPLNPRLNP